MEISLKRIGINHFQRNHLLAIGINNYTSGIQRLFNCEKDVLDLAHVLQSQYQFIGSNVKVYTGEEATRKNLIRELVHYKCTLTDRDNLVIFFSGHGQVIDELPYWLPHEAVQGEEDTYISADDIFNRLKFIKCKHLLLIVDACFSAKLFRLTRSIDRQLDENLSSRFGFAATLDTEYASDGEPETNSPFAYHLINYLKNNKTPLDIETLAKAVQIQVKKDTQNLQNPVFLPLFLREHKYGKYFLYPKSSLSELEEAFTISRSGQLGDGISKLRNLLLRQPLEQDYQIFLCCCKNRLTRYQKIEKNHLFNSSDLEEFNELFEINLAKKLKVGLNSKKIHVQELSSVLRLIENDKILKALDLLQAQYFSCPKIYSRILLFQYRFLRIRLELEGETKYQHIEIEELYNYYVELLVLFIRNIEDHDYDIKDNLQYSVALFYDGLIDDSLLALEDYIIRYVGRTDEWYLIKILIRWHSEWLNGAIQDKSRTNATKGQVSYLNDRIRLGFEYLVKRISMSSGTKSSFPVDFKGVPRQIRKKEALNLFTSLIAQGIWKDIASFIDNELSIDLDLAKFFPFRTKLNPELQTVESDLHEQLCKEIRTWWFFWKHLNLQNGSEIDTPGISNNEKMLYRASFDEMSLDEKLDLIGGMVANNNLSDALTSLDLLVKGSKVESDISRLISIERLNEEDMLFTSKDRDMLIKRRDRIVQEILNIVQEIEMG